MEDPRMLIRNPDGTTWAHVPEEHMRLRESNERAARRDMSRFIAVFGGLLLVVYFVGRNWQ
jgi:hypothetical protein